MKKPFKVLLKIAGVLFVFILILCIWLFFGIKNAYKEVYSEEDTKKIVSEIKQAPTIPDDFKRHIEFVYPNIFKISVNKYAFNSFFNDYKLHVQAEAFLLHIIIFQKNVHSFLDQFLLVWPGN